MLATKNLADPCRAAIWLRGVPLVVLLAMVSCMPPGPKALLEGERFVRAGDSAQAVERCLVATELLPSNPHAWNYLGLAFHGAGKPAEARLAYTQALSRDRNLAIVRFNLGCLMLETADYPAAVNEFTAFTVLQQQSEQGLVKLASAQIKTRAYEAAEATLKKALQLNPHNPESRNNLGCLLLQKRRGREAYNQFLAAIQTDPKYAPALLNLAIVSQQMNNRPLALKAYKDYLQHRKEPFLPGPELIEAWIAQLTAELQPVAKPLGSASTNATPGQATIHTPSSPPLLSNPLRPSVAEDVHPLLPAAVEPPAIPQQPQIAHASEPKTNPDSARKSPVSAPSADVTRPVTPPPTTVSEAQKSPTPEPIEAKPKPEPQSLLVSKKPKPSPVLSAAAPPAANIPLPPLVGVAVPKPEDNKIRLTAPAGDSAAIRSIPPELVPAASVPTAPSGTEERPQAALIDPEKTGFWQRANPVRWFRSSEKRSTPTTPLRASNSPALNGGVGKPGGPRPSAADRKTIPSASAPVVQSIRRSDSVEKVVEVATVSIPRSGPRYARRFTAPLIAGDMEKSTEEINLGLELRQKGKLEDALKAYRRAVAADPRHYEARYHLALGLSESADLEGSLAAYEAAVSLKPDAIPARYNFALALRNSGYAEDSAEQAAAILSSFPKEVRAHLLLGSLWAGELAVFPKAREHYRAVIEIEPRHPQSAVIRTWLATHP